MPPRRIVCDDSDSDSDTDNLQQSTWTVEEAVTAMKVDTSITQSPSANASPTRTSTRQTAQSPLVSAAIKRSSQESLKSPNSPKKISLKSSKKSSKREANEVPEPMQAVKKVKAPILSDDDQDSDTTLSKIASSSSYAATTSKRTWAIDEDSDADSDVPLAKAKSHSLKKKSKKESSQSPVIKEHKLIKTSKIKSSQSPVIKEHKLIKKSKKIAEQDSRDADSDSSDDDDDDVPLAKKIKSKKSTKKSQKVTNALPYDSDSDVPLANKIKKTEKKRTVKAKPAKGKEPATDVDSSPKKKGKKADEEEEAIFKWWEENDRDDSIKWTTLEHAGVVFPPAYIPHGVQMLYDGKPVTLSPASEEVAGFFAAMLGSVWVENETFCNNFFDDLQEVLKKHDKNSPIKEFAKCDFTPMFDHFAQVKEAKKAMTKAEKEVLKAEKATLEAQYGFATIDGRKEKVGNFRIEPPGLFRGRGDHPKTGKLKHRVMPEQVTINCGKDSKIPTAPSGHKWGKASHDNTVSWLATWTENVNGNIKYVFFAAGSSLKGMSDFKKFEKARELKKIIHNIRRDYTADLKDKMMATRQRATAMWLIDRLALRAGNEKGEDEADTVGCCSLRCEHIKLEEDNEEIDNPEKPGENMAITKKMVVFDFLGKDSIRYYNRVEVDPMVWKNLKIFMKTPKVDSDPIFDRLDVSKLNSHLTGIMPGLTAKVFRTYNASHCMQIELAKNTDVGSSLPEKILAYNRANRQVAILCNHQRTVAKSFGQQMEKMTEKILTFKFERHMVAKEMLKLDPKLKKSMPELVEQDEELDDETIERKKKEYDEREQLKLDKRYEKMCEKAKEEGRAVPAKPEIGSKTEMTVERLAKKFVSFTAKIEQSNMAKTDKDENKTTALGTSKINYIDPRITAAWCAKFEVPIDKMFPKTLRDKFKWAVDVDADWTF